MMVHSRGNRETSGHQTANRDHHSSHTNSRKRGVAILISNSTTMECLNERKDKEGRYITVKGMIEHIGTT